MKFIVVDLSNLFFRCRHVVQKEPDPEVKAAVAVATVFGSLRKMHRNIGADHIVFAVDHGSWRTAVYPMYKAARRLNKQLMKQSEIEENQIFENTFNKLIEYFSTKTKCTVLNEKNIEGDDFVARFVQNYPNDEHIIVSADSDFIQLLDKNIKIYDGINDRFISTDGVTDASGKKLAFKVDSGSGKLKILEKNPDFIPEDAEWWKKALFVKLIRGDSGDGVFSAHARVPYKTTSKKIGIEDAWNDRKNQEYHWNNFMLQEWKKPIGFDEKGDIVKKNVRVIDEFKINEMLIDLTKQPEEIKAIMDEVISRETSKKIASGNIGFGFGRFCLQLDLPGLAAEVDHITYLNKAFPNEYSTTK